jgi:hypothetical protein
MTISISPLVDEPVTVVENRLKILLIADLHLGIERDLRRYGINIPSQTNKILNRVLRNVKQTNPDRIVLLGDVKHHVPGSSWQEEKEIPYFLDRLAEHTPVDITPGNHDGSISKLIPESKGISLHKSSGFILDGIGYFHGHAWPSVELFATKHVFMGHEHPIVRLRDELGYVMTRRVWIRTTFNENTILSRYNEIDWRDPSLTIVPAFNELCGGIAFNEKHVNLLGPVPMEIDKSRVYLTDGICIGDTETLRRFI